jgi:hypothetical protein
LKSLSKDKFVYLFLAGFFLVTTLLAYFSTGTYESGDSIQHYLIARYSFRHPGLFLNHWGKPFFVLLSSSFAQFGFLGINLFNIACATLTGLFSYKIAQKLQLPYSWLAPVFALFAPIYYVTLITGLTEPLFALVLTTGIYLLLRKNFIASALLISFLPFVRTEGFILLPLFALTYFLPTLRRPFLIQNLTFSIQNNFFLMSGTIVYSLAGYFYHHDLFWIISQNPYQGAKDIYGSGTPFHFLAKNEFILGTPLVVLFCTGCIAYFIPGRYADRQAQAQAQAPVSVIELLLIPGVFLTYLILHSVFWWKGMNGSLGLIRVMAGVAPLAGIIALRGLGLLSTWLSAGISAIPHSVKLTGLKPVLLIILSALVIYMPFKQHHFPSALGYEDVVVNQAATWLKQQHPELCGQNQNYYYQYPYLSVFLNNDPFDRKHYTPLWSSRPENVQSGSILIWDSHYGAGEARLPLNLFLSDSSFEQLYSQHADPASIPRDKTMFEVYIFRKK